MDGAIEAIGNTIRKDSERVVEFVMLLEDDPESNAKTVLGIGSELLAYVRDAA